MPIATRTFRVFVSSTFEDLKEERDALQRDVFPKLRTLCEQHGARFQAIDLRWGVRDEAALDQQTMAICIREIERCKATGVRPNFIALLGDRYGWRPLPVTTPASEFDVLKPHLSVGDAKLAEHWYRLDENAVPPEYCLQPRTGKFVEPSAWNQVEESLLQALATAARAAGLSENELVKYEASATHQEILAGLGETEEDRQHVFGFVRRSTENADSQLEALKAHLRVHEFGAGDMNGLCELVLTELTKVIVREVKRFEDRPALDLEIEAHADFAKDRARIFTGRQAVLDTIADYIGGPERRRLVLHGESGSGKSAVMAKASQKYKGPGRMIRRFIGASPESAGGHALLTSLCQQIAPGETPVDYAQLENAFRERLANATEEQPLVLFIDALDQLAASDPAREATWLPPELPPHVKVILSTTGDGEPLPEGPLVRLEHMAQSEGAQALDELLRDTHRTLQSWQREKVLVQIDRCGLPLYLKLAAEESRLWKSYTPESACTLGGGIAGVIDTLFDRLASNANHGPTLVERSLSYLAAARYGLTEDEVLDVLTADDSVWNDFDQRKHHEVSERRLPVVVWSALSLDLEPYLTERAAPGGTVIAFYHRQLQERVAGRFEVQSRHSDLARYFFTRPVPDTRRLVELPFQQREAHQWTEAEATLFDSRFLSAKCAAGMVLDLDADYQAFLQDAAANALPRREALGLIHGALRLSMHVLLRDSRRYASQMLGRLLWLRNRPGVAIFALDVKESAERPWIRPLQPYLDAPGGPLLRVLEGHSDYVLGVAVTADGKRAVSASADTTLKVWNLETGRLLHTLENHSDFVNSVAVTADGRRAVSASRDMTVKVWNLETGSLMTTLEGNLGGVNGVAVSADGKRAVSASGKTLRVWDLDGNRVLHILEGHSGWINGVAITADGNLAVSASRDTTLKTWDLKTGHVLRTLEGHSHYVNGVAITPDGTLAVSAAEDDTLKVWDLDAGHELCTLRGHSHAVRAVALTADRKRAVSGSNDKTLKVWNLHSCSVLDTLNGQAEFSDVALTADGGRAVSASGNSLIVWDLAPGWKQHDLKAHGSEVDVVAIAGNGTRAVSASKDETLRVWDCTTGQELHTLEGRWGILSLAVTTDGKRAVSTFMNVVEVLDLETGKVLRTLEGHRSAVWGVAVTKDGKRVVSASYDKTLRVWDMETGQMLQTLEGHSAGVWGVAVTADARRAVSISFDKTFRLWDLETGRALRTVEGHCGWAYGFAVTSDGRRAVAVSEDKALRVWGLETGRVLQTLGGLSDKVSGGQGGRWRIALTADGKHVVSASRGETLNVWDLETGAAVTAFSCEDNACCCACAAPNLIVAGDEGGRVYFLALEE
jgi:WD40 repeat protein